MVNGRERIQWVDIVKGIAIIAVVLLHSDYHFCDSPLLPLWSILGNSWHVGVFFVMSGYFMKEEKVRDTVRFIKEKFSSLYLKLIVAYTVCILLHNFFFTIGFYDAHYDYSGKFIAPYSLTEIPQRLILAYLGLGREPILSALWFVYCLFASFITYALISRLLRWVPVSEKTYERMRCFIIFFLCMAFHVVQNTLEVNIPRYGNLFTIMWLIYLGYLLGNKLKLKYDNTRLAVITFVVFYLSNILFGPNRIVTNTYHNVISMMLCVTSAMYFLAYICKKMEGGIVGRGLGIIGRQSFHIMTWHLLAFKLLTVLLNSCGMNLNLAQLNSPDAGSVLLLLLYTAVGVLLPAIVFHSLSSWKCKTR